jgi:hypothetical protein
LFIARTTKQHLLLPTFRRTWRPTWSPPQHTRWPCRARHCIKTRMSITASAFQVSEGLHFPHLCVWCWPPVSADVLPATVELDNVVICDNRLHHLHVIRRHRHVTHFLHVRIPPPSDSLIIAAFSKRMHTPPSPSQASPFPPQAPPSREPEPVRPHLYAHTHTHSHTNTHGVTI